MWILTMTLISSIDCVLAGVSYATRGIRIPFLSKFVLFITVLVIGLLASALSVALVKLIPPELASILAEIVLIVLAVLMLLSAILDKKPRQKEKSASNSLESKTLFKLVLRSAGITIQVLKNPEDADINDSGRIDPLESMLLAVALTLDAVGFILCGTLMNQTSLWFPVAISIGHLMGLILGERFGSLIASKINHGIIKYLPALLLMAVAGIELMQ